MESSAHLAKQSKQHHTHSFFLSTQPQLLFLKMTAWFVYTLIVLAQPTGLSRELFFVLFFVHGHGVAELICRSEGGER